MTLPAVAPALKRVHEQRLRAVYRSAGWPCLDPVEIDLLAAGLLERIKPHKGPEYLRVTDVGIRHLSQVSDRNRKALGPHEALVARVAEEQIQNGRIAYRGLTLMAKPGDGWLDLKPDVFSIRNTTVEDYVEPIVHEIKVTRADLKSDLRKPEKRAGYIALSSACYYVLGEKVGTPDDVPPECGVMLATERGVELLRPAPKRAMRLSFMHWIELAKAHRCYSLAERAPGL